MRNSKQTKGETASRREEGKIDERNRTSIQQKKRVNNRRNKQTKETSRQRRQEDTLGEEEQVDERDK